MLLQTPRHHLIRDPASESSILIIESHANGSQNPPFINSLSRSATGAITAHPGKTLGAGECKLRTPYLWEVRVKPFQRFAGAGSPNRE